MSRSESIHQFVRFSAVGASGFVVDFGVFNLLYWHVPFFHTWYLAANMISFSLAVINNFFWHKRWTFRVKSPQAPLGEGERLTHPSPDPPPGPRLGAQFTAFVIVSVIGLGLNTTILKIVSQQDPVQAMFGKHAPVVAKVVATGIVWFWNFGANKFWTFRKG